MPEWSPRTEPTASSVIADLVSGKAPQIRADDLAVFRYAGTPGAPGAADLARSAVEEDIA